MNGFTAPHIEYAELSPVFLILLAAVLGVLVEAFAPRRLRLPLQIGVSLAGTLGALLAAVLVFVHVDPGARSGGAVAAEGSFALDGPTLVCWVLILVLAVLAVLLFADRRLEGGVTGFSGQAAALPGTEAEREASARGLEHTEVFPLLLFAVSGMLMFPAASDLITMFVALEVLSLPLYLLCGLARRRRLLSQESAMKYFMLGAFSSGFLVYGMALVYGYAGSFDFAGIAQAVGGRTGGSGLLLGGLGLLAVGLLFKVGAAPFHAWTPDVYQGAPTAVTAFMSAATKVAAFGAMMRLLYVAFGAARWSWIPMLWIVAIISMVAGTVMALTQRDVKRLLAYSSIAHAGFILVGVVGARSLTESPGSINPVQAVLFYLTTYAFTVMAAFALVSVVRDGGGETTSLERWSGMGRRSPLVAGVMAFLLLGMAGIPLTSGFTGKWALFASAFAAHAWPIVLVAVLVSAVALFIYVKVIVVMFFSEPVGEGPSIARPSLPTAAVIGLGTLVTLVLGVVPGPLLDLIGRVGVFVR